MSCCYTAVCDAVVQLDASYFRRWQLEWNTKQHSWQYVILFEYCCSTWLLLSITLRSFINLELVSFDLFSACDSSSSSSSIFSQTVIIAVAAGGGGLLFLILCFCCWCVAVLLLFFSFSFFVSVFFFALSFPLCLLTFVLISSFASCFSVAAGTRCSVTVEKMKRANRAPPNPSVVVEVKHRSNAQWRCKAATQQACTRNSSNSNSRWRLHLTPLSLLLQVSSSPLCF